MLLQVMSVLYLFTSNPYSISQTALLKSSSDNEHHCLIFELKMSIFKFIHLLKCIYRFY